MTLAPGSRLGPYEILAPLGAGAMGEVYRARDPRLSRDVALKILPDAFAADAERLRRFEQEVRAAGQLNHPNILVAHDVGTQDGSPYLVTELLEGESLRDRLRGGALPVPKALHYAIQIARGLGAAHGRGIIHRDLKPENLFVLRDGRVKILDFGIAKLTRPETPPSAGATARTVTSGSTVFTDPNVTLGTVGYMSPEQVRGLSVDHRSDLFAFGAVLYEVLSGQRAFRGTTPADTLTAILREDPPELSGDQDAILPALDRIVRHCLEKEPGDRFQSASDVAFALETLTAPSHLSPKPTPRPRGRVYRALTPLLAGFALVVAGAWLVHRAAHPRGPQIASFQKLTFQRGILTGAGFAADDNSILYSAEWDGRSSEIFSSDPQSPGSQRLTLSDARLLAVSRSNELAILIETQARPHNLAVGTLARMPVSGGSPRKLLENVIHADWAPGGSDLAVVHQVGNRYQLEYPIGRVLYVSPGWISHARVSPDGDRVGILDHPVFPDDRGAVLVVDRKGRRHLLSDGWASLQGLAWSAKGNEIWFTATRSGTGRSLYAVNMGGRLRTLQAVPGDALLYDVSRSGGLLLSNEGSSVGMRARAPGEKGERELTWLDWSGPQDLSPDGRSVLFSEQGIGGGAHYAVCLRGIDGSPPVRLGEGLGHDLSPDGAWVLTTRFWETPPQLELLPTGTGQRTLLPETGLENIAGACFFPDGDRLLIVGNERHHALRAYVRGLNGGPLRPVMPEGVRASEGGVAVSPDGNWIAGFTPGSGLELYPAAGGPPRRVPGVLPDEFACGWSRDSRAVYVGKRFGSFPLKVFRINLETGKRTPSLDSPGPQDLAGAKHGETFLGSDEHTYIYAYSRTIDDLYLVRGLR